jgi:hypothetical protein
MEFAKLWHFKVIQDYVLNSFGFSSRDQAWRYFAIIREQAHFKAALDEQNLSPIGGTACQGELCKSYGGSIGIRP